MRINRNMLLKLANDAVNKYVSQDRSVLAIYLQGSLLGESPLIGNTADIDLFLVHREDVSVEREIIKVSDEVHLDISHHSHKLYRQPRELRVHSWLGPAIYGCKILYDPQHFMDFVQASVRGQFSNPDNVLIRARTQANHAREMWNSLSTLSHPPKPSEAELYLRALEHVANAVAGLSGHTLTERRFLLDLPQSAEAVQKPGLVAGFLGLLGAQAVDSSTLRTWLPDWQNSYTALPVGSAPIRLHPYRFLYYQQAMDVILNSKTAHDALWPLWHTWTHAICALPAEAQPRSGWQKAGEQLGLLGGGFTEKVGALDAYLDSVEELLESWAKENGG